MTMENNKPSGDEEKTDPKENSRPLVENNDREKDIDGVEAQPSRLDDLRTRAKHFAANRYNVIIVLLCVLLLIFLFIVIGLGARLGSYKCPEPDHCRSAECLAAASSVIARADHTKNPCSDFWSFSCKGWFQRNQLPNGKGSYSVLDELRTTIYHRIRHLIDLVPHGADVGSPELKVKNFYTSCMNLAEIEYWLPLKFDYLIQEIGGWPLLKKTSTVQWKRNEVLKKLHVAFGVPVYFRVLVEPNDVDPSKNIIKLIPDGLGLPSPKYYFYPIDHVLVKAYKQFMTNLLMVMSVEVNIANRFAENMFAYEKRLAEITPEAPALRDTVRNYKVMTVSELDKLSTSISWSNLLQSYFPDVVRPHTEIAILSEQYFSDLSTLISSTDTRLLNDYYMWRLLFTYVMHLSSKHRSVANQFYQAFEGVDSPNIPHTERWEYCIDLTSQYLGHAVGAMYMNEYVNSEQKKEVSTYVHKVIGAFSSMTRRLYWLSDSSTHDAALGKILSAIPQLEYPGFDPNCTVSDYYKEWVVQADYFQNIKDGLQFRLTKQRVMLQQGAFSACSWPVPPHGVNAYYSYAGNQLVVPSGLLQEPLFNINSPLAVKYGVLAGHVANKLAAMFDYKGVNYDTFGQLQHWMSNFSMGTYNERVNCLLKRLSNYSVNSVPVDANLTISNFIADVGGVKLAYEAYLRHIREIGHEKELPGIRLDNKQLFFVSYAQSLCEESREKKLSAFHDSAQTLPAELRVTAVLQQMPEFSDVFGCKEKSQMNSVRRCNMW